MSSIEIGTWTPIGPTQGGATIAIAGELTAVAGPGHVVVWTGMQRVCQVEAPCPAPGTPRFRNGQLLWGPGVLDLNTNSYEVIEAACPQIRPGGGQRPSIYAWSPNGARLVAGYSTGEADHQTRVTLFDGIGGQPIAELLRGNELPPQAVWVGREVAVVGFREPRLFSLATGAAQGMLPLDAGIITRLDADQDERFLIAVDLNRSVILIDQSRMTVVDRWEGRWQDAVISPDGRFLSALDMEGSMHFACLSDRGFQTLGEPDKSIRANSVALGDNVIAVASGGVAARATLRIDCAD